MPSHELDHQYCTTQARRLRPCAQMVVRAADPGLNGPQLAALVRERAATVLRGRQRNSAAGLKAGMRRCALAAPRWWPRPIGPWGSSR